MVVDVSLMGFKEIALRVLDVGEFNFDSAQIIVYNHLFVILILRLFQIAQCTFLVVFLIILNSSFKVVKKALGSSNRFDSN